MRVGGRVSGRTDLCDMEHKEELYCADGFARADAFTALIEHTEHKYASAVQLTNASKDE